MIETEKKQERILLVGVELQGTDNFDMSMEELASLGFDADRLRDIRRSRQEARLPWPHPVPIELRREIGFARYDAALAEARELLGLTGLEPSRPARRRLSRDEERLVADRPPHW